MGQASFRLIGLLDRRRRPGSRPPTARRPVGFRDHRRSGCSSTSPRCCAIAGLAGCSPGGRGDGGAHQGGARSTWQDDPRFAPLPAEQAAARARSWPGSCSRPKLPLRVLLGLLDPSAAHRGRRPDRGPRPRPVAVNRRPRPRTSGWTLVEERLGTDTFLIMPTAFGYAAAGLLSMAVGSSARPRRSGPERCSPTVRRGLPHNVTTEMDLELWRLASRIRARQRLGRGDGRPDRSADLASALPAPGSCPPVVQDGLADFLRPVRAPRRRRDRPRHAPLVGRARAPARRARQLPAAGRPRAAPRIASSPGAPGRRGGASARSSSPTRRAGRARSTARSAGRAWRCTGPAAADRAAGAAEVHPGRSPSPRSAAELRLVGDGGRGRGGDRRSPTTSSSSICAEAARALRRRADQREPRPGAPGGVRGGAAPPPHPAGAALRRHRAGGPDRRRRRPDGALVGTPASAGTVTGPARVVLDPVGAHLEPGEILVAPSTDPGWTPLFLTAGGLVMEMGGSNSHGAVVAREYGIPAVVGVPDATAPISTGQLDHRRRRRRRRDAGRDARRRCGRHRHGLGRRRAG